ncbi:hypothetical protein SNE40_000754 [Patella caerulea]|uniref:Carbohydrate sulfotransferase n=1 Tax=Patella caerulea TaxID=87958 RepID=A0AAN8KHT1_PATCE
MEHIFSTRRKRIRDACLLDTRGRVQGLMIYKAANLSYCVVPKAGCTFWKRIFRFLNGDTGNSDIISPFKINRMIVHYGSYKHMGRLSFSNMTDRYFLSNTNRLVVARDPYSRLWAVYLDKFFLPDFWRSHGQVIIRKRMKEPWGLKGQRKVCADDISFQEFISYVIATESRGYGGNEHWVPINRLCNPCKFNPDYVSTMETFTRDAKYILRKVGLESVLKNQPHSYLKDEIHMLIKYNFQLLKEKFNKKCTNLLTLCKRLWAVFQMNGFISPNDPFPEVIEFRPSLVDAQLFCDEVIKKVRAHKISNSERWKQKRDAMEAAYRKLPLSLLRMIPYIYEHDFRLFGYRPYPSGIFKNHTAYKDRLDHVF